jgi:hypothetical protein
MYNSIGGSQRKKDNFKALEQNHNNLEKAQRARIQEARQQLSENPNDPRLAERVRRLESSLEHLLASKKALDDGIAQAFNKATEAHGIATDNTKKIDVLEAKTEDLGHRITKESEERKANEKSGSDVVNFMRERDEKFETEKLRLKEKYKQKLEEKVEDVKADFIVTVEKLEGEVLYLKEALRAGRDGVARGPGDDAFDLTSDNEMEGQSVGVDYMFQKWSPEKRMNFLYMLYDELTEEKNIGRMAEDVIITLFNAAKDTRTHFRQRVFALKCIEEAWNFQDEELCDALIDKKILDEVCEIYRKPHQLEEIVDGAAAIIMAITENYRLSRPEDQPTVDAGVLSLHDKIPLIVKSEAHGRSESRARLVCPRCFFIIKRKEVSQAKNYLKYHLGLEKQTKDIPCKGRVTTVENVLRMFKQFCGTELTAASKRGRPRKTPTPQPVLGKRKGSSQARTPTRKAPSQAPTPTLKTRSPRVDYRI